MRLCAWDTLPDTMRTPAVRPYYDGLRSRTAALVGKRVIDVTMALILLVLLSPVLLVLAIWIKCDSPGPVFFRQVRITQNGRPFRIWKFRTMVADAEAHGTQVTVDGDSRITRVGSRLRRLRLDEIPQLFNVLAGEMSFVGARPEVPRYVEHYAPDMWATLLLPAGITCQASLNFKDEDRLLQAGDDPDETYVREILPRKMADNLDYLRHFSLHGDMALMLRTVGQVFVSK